VRWAPKTCCSYARALRLADALSLFEKSLLRLHYADGLDIGRIGRLYKIHRSTVARRLAEYRRKPREHAGEVAEAAQADRVGVRECAFPGSQSAGRQPPIGTQESSASSKGVERAPCRQPDEIRVASFDRE
jgi:hypothetical protein